MEQVLTQLAQSVTSASDLEGLTRPLLVLLETVTGLESTYLTSIDEQKGLQHILFSRNSKTLQIPEGLSVPWHDTLCKRALEENRPFTDDVEGCWGDSDAARALGIKTYLSQPVRTIDGGVYGTLCAASGSKTSVSPENIKVLGLFAELIARQVERERVLSGLKRANEELSATVLTDPLTGVANRRGLIQELQRVINQGKRDQRTVQVAFIDLDGFKAINDQHGHEVGDQFLVHIARRLSEGTRPHDLVARYGGDEFVVVVSNSNPEELRKRLETLTIGRYTCGSLVIDYRGASVGIASGEAATTDAESLLSRADAAMYASKRTRKAQIATLN